MKIRILFFAELREMFGEPRWIEVPQDISIAGVVFLLSRSSPRFSEKRPLVYAVNEDFETEEKKLSEGDHLAVMMPMSGG